MDFVKEMIGKKWPIKDLNDNIVMYKPVINARHVEDRAAIVISLDDHPDSGVVLITHLAALKFLEN